MVMKNLSIAIKGITVSAVADINAQDLRKAQNMNNHHNFRISPLQGGLGANFFYTLAF